MSVQQIRIPRRANVENLAVSGSYNHQLQQLPKIRRSGVYQSQRQHFSTETAHNQETFLQALAPEKVYTCVWRIWKVIEFIYFTTPSDYLHWVAI
jgi:hypothetical protein